MQEALNPVDWLLILIMVVTAIAGFMKGFIVGVLDLVSLILSFVAALWGYQYVASFVESFISDVGVWSMPLAFILVFIIVRIFSGVASRAFGNTLPEETHGHVANRLLGMVPGFVNGFIYACVIAALLLSLPILDGLTSRAQHSMLTNRLSVYVEQVEEQLAPVFEEAISRTMNKMTVKPGSNERLDLPFKVINPKPRPDLETRMLQLVNDERAKEGLNALVADSALRNVARAHSSDMFSRQSFAHVPPDSISPFDRIKRAGIRYRTAGENLALAQSLNIAHTGLMNSPGHRANILYPLYGRVGIGVLDGGRYGLMVTQVFRN